LSEKEEKIMRWTVGTPDFSLCACYEWSVFFAGEWEWESNPFAGAQKRGRKIMRRTVGTLIFSLARGRIYFFLLAVEMGRFRNIMCENKKKGYRYVLCCFVNLLGILCVELSVENPTGNFSKCRIETLNRCYRFLLLKILGSCMRISC
jgi:hypothetical protein